jgi:two-component system, OmpR family, sensor kinase
VSLTTRVSLFFLGTLALVLAGFSVTLYALAQAHLHRQDDERLRAALDTLAAAAEVTPEGVEWEPHERQLSVGGPAAPVYWVVHDPLDTVVDHSSGFESAPWPRSGSAALASFDQRDVAGQLWRFLRRRLEPAGAVAIPSPPQAIGEPKKHRFLTLTVGLPQGATQATLASLAWWLGGTSAALWLLALAGGRWFCRRALSPLNRMAATAGAMRGDDSAARLPVPETRDQLETFGQSFNGLLDRLQVAYERQRRFTGDASHQLRTPLAALLGQLEVALRRERGPDEYRQALEAAHGRASDLRRIVESLLFLTRADAEAAAPQLGPLELQEWLNAQLGRWVDHLRAADLHCEAGTPASVRAHPELLAQALGNMIDNALNYSRPGTPVICRLREEKGTARLEVEDEGLGVSAEDMPHLFDPFYRSEQARRAGTPGAGLGLSVAARIAAVLGGRIEVESVPGRGSRFTIVLPAKA